MGRSLRLVLVAAAALATPSFAAISLYTAPEVLSAAAPWVVEGTVTRIGSGYDPVTATLRTYVTVEIETVHRGPAGLRRVVVRQPGGSFGGLVHAVDAVPAFEPGERVFLFLEPGKDGALRTTGMFFGKFRVVQGSSAEADRAERDLSGHGLILGVRDATSRMEVFPRHVLVAIVAKVRFRGRPVAPVSVPPEWDRLLWDDVRPAETGSGQTPGTAGSPGSTADLDASPASGLPPDFVPLSTSTPVRWDEADAGTAVPVNIEPARNPMSNNAAAIAEIHRAMAAWTGVPEARVALQSVNDNYNFTGTNAQGPADAYPPVSIVLFGDPYDDIADPSGCGGTLAIGGYWRSGSLGKTVNNVTFYPALRLYVIFNRNFECFLGNADNLAEVATHEFGHGLGFGHSAVADAVMRSSAYGSRGPRLGSDDRDGAHCHYPHTLSVTSPNGGESWAGGSSHPITWTTTAESGGNPGTVNLEFSSTGGASWSPIASSEANDGTYTWTVPATATTQGRVRVIRPNQVTPTPSPYPSACSSDPSNANFTITIATAGSAPDGSSGIPLSLAKGAATDLTLSWGTSCSSGATDYAVYEGSLASLRSGSWNHAPAVCAAGLDRTQTITPGAGDRYFLVAPRIATHEGRLGRTSSGVERPAAAAACVPREASSCE